ncbi:hypothetical protein BH23PAT1_BH23PAT1_3540 [soil metagenome]
MPDILTTGQVKRLGTIMGIWAHPDDESFAMAGLMATAAQNNQTVVCITATKGESGVQNGQKMPARQLGKIRQKELKNALQILGVKHHHWLEYPDGGCHMVSDEEAADRLRNLIEKYKPDTVITFPPDGITGHLDHVAVSRWTGQALAGMPAVSIYYVVETRQQYDSFTSLLDQKFNVFFNIDEPTLIPEEDCDVIFELSSELAELKSDALAKMPSQFSGIINEVGLESLKRSMRKEAFVRADKPLKWGTPGKA